MDKATTAPTRPPAGVGFVISAPSSGQGKTSVTLGLLRALRRQGVDVASAKSGPDYIDPAFHRAATGRDCVTLDAWAMNANCLRGRTVWSGAALTVVEGAMGLFDGPAVKTASGALAPGSTGHLAAHLGFPVILVLDARRMGQSAGAIVHGLASWSGSVTVSGVILNRVASERHETMLRDAVERTCPVLGVVRSDPRLSMPSRHLGLVQAEEMDGLDAFLEGAADVVEASCDLDAIASLASELPLGQIQHRLKPIGQRIAVAKDVAFSFIYPHVLEDWRELGAELTFFSPLSDQAPDVDADAVFLAGGYPELHAGVLAGNANFLEGLRRAASDGAVVYGECGGFMVLGDALTDADGVSHRMAGLLSLETSFADRKRHLGYRKLTPHAGPWSEPLAAHEFHYSMILRSEGPPLFRASDAAGAELPDMGLVRGNVMGSYAHIISPAMATESD